MKPDPADQLREDLKTALGDLNDERLDGLSRVLMRLMETDPESNVVFGNTPPGEAEDWAAQVAYAEAIGSPVMLRYVNLANMGKRAEKAGLLKSILEAVKAIGKGAPDKPGIFQRFRG